MILGLILGTGVTYAVVSHGADQVFFSDGSSLAGLVAGGAQICTSALSGDTNCIDAVGITTETDPTVPAGIKDGITWTEVSNRPAGLDDGDQVGITSETDPQVDSVVNARICQGDANGYVDCNLVQDASGDCGAGYVCIGGHDHDSRYYTEAESNTNYVNAVGDTMTGGLLISGGSFEVAGGNTRLDNYVYITDYDGESASEDVSMIARDGNLQHRSGGVVIGSYANGDATVGALDTGDLLVKDSLIAQGYFRLPVRSGNPFNCNMNTVGYAYVDTTSVDTICLCADIAGGGWAWIDISNPSGPACT
ncbi:MAG: hypothetical protein KKD18_02385 [Nanoarchaeota archaeon]|nr:hypothetical protein [Nanoarchaeota archaeon]